MATPPTSVNITCGPMRQTAQSLFIWAAAAVVLLTALRVLGLIVSPMELHGDEAQYWTWSQTLDWGYYSKPPLIAWTIALMTTLFGDSEWAIRMFAPFAHGVAALFLGLLGRALYGDRAGAAAALIYITMPAVWLSAGLASTDALLLAFWSAALFFLHRFIETRALHWAIATGIAAGLGFMAKYAMVYFGVGAGLLLLQSSQVRAALISFKGLAMACVTLAIVSPNLMWNAAHEFTTLAHTADNANWSGPRFRPGKLGEFWQEQLAVFGPLLLPLLLAVLFASARDGQDRRSKATFLLAFILPVLVIISAQAFINRANANWAATAYAGASVLLAGWLFGPGGAWERLAHWRQSLVRTVFIGGLALNILGGGLLAMAGVSRVMADEILCTPAFFPGERACAGAGFKRARGWQATAEAVEARFQTGFEGQRFSAIVLDNRLVFHDLEYYLRADPAPLRMWRKYATAKSYAEEHAPLTTADTADDAPVLIASVRQRDQDLIAADFETITPLGVSEIDLGPAGVRRIWFFAGEGFAPASRSGV